MLKKNQKTIIKNLKKGNGKEYCDECGLSFVRPNVMRVVGGLPALQASWPSAALVIISYKADVQLDEDLVHVAASFMCGGTLINRKTGNFV